MIYDSFSLLICYRLYLQGRRPANRTGFETNSLSCLLWHELKFESVRGSLRFLCFASSRKTAQWKSCGIPTSDGNSSGEALYLARSTPRCNRSHWTAYPPQKVYSILCDAWAVLILCSDSCTSHDTQYEPDLCTNIYTTFSALSRSCLQPTHATHDSSHDDATYGAANGSNDLDDLSLWCGSRCV